MIHSTIYDVAVRAGVSVATVSRTFAKPDIVTEATRKKVIEAANELDFAISRSATALKSKHTFRIAMLTGEAIVTWFDSNLYKGLTEVLQTHGYDVSSTALRTPNSACRSSTSCPCAAMSTR